MKCRIIVAQIIALSVLVLSSCEKDSVGPKNAKVSNVYIIDYGNYTGTKSSISSYDEDKDSITHNIYESANGFELNSNVQNIGIFNDDAYLMSNSGDKIDIVNAKTFEASVNPIGEGIVKPRYIVFKDAVAYVSCWGDVKDWSALNSSYIAKVDISSRKVIEKIELPGGPEGLAIANGKLYAALNYKDSIAVINLANDAVSYIEMPAVSSYFLKDDNENLYVSFVSTYSDPSTESGIGYLNTSADTLENNYKLDGITSSYGSIMQFNKDKSKIHIIASAWVEVDGNWIQQGAINTFNVTSKTFDVEPFLAGISGINGISVNPENDNVYCLISTGATTSGEMKIYSADGDLITTQATGVAPFMAVFVE